MSYHKCNKTMEIGDKVKIICTDCFNKISDLEAKLAESEKNVEFYKERYSEATTSAYGADLMAKDYQWHLEKEIQELKQQLAESKEEIKVIDEDRQFKAEMWTRFADKCKELEKQLAEKEKELNDWKDGTIICKWTDAENKVKELEQQLAEKEELIMFSDRTVKGLVLAKEIDKISFAVEQLEKVKEYFNGMFSISVQQEMFDDYIDNQIKQLKEMK